MINVTELDRRVADYGALVARINQEGWKRDAASTRSIRGGGIAAFVSRTREQVGVVLIRIGARLQGAPARHASDAAAAS